MSARSAKGNTKKEKTHMQKIVGKKDFRFVLGTRYYAVSDAARLPKGRFIIDPVFYTEIRRITDKKVDRYIGPGIQNEYAKADPENSDGMRLILRGNTAAWYLYELPTYKKIRQLKVFDECGQEPEPRWDSTNPKLFYYLCNMRFKSYDIDTKKSTTIHDFKKEFPAGAYLTTGSEGDSSTDRRYWCFMVKDASWKLLSVIAYDKESNKVVGRKSHSFPDSINWVGMDASGSHCIVGYDELLYPHVFSRDLSRQLALPKGSNGHGDVALTADKKDVLVYQNVINDYIAMADLETGKETLLVKIPFMVNTDIGLHVSGNCVETPGWVLVSTYGAKNPPPDRKHSWMDNQLFMIELKQDPRIWRIAHTYSYTSVKPSEEKNYFAEAFAAINKKGTRVYFGSNWGDFSPEYTDTYEVTLPNNWVSRIPE
jgi:hypothetical protein